MGRFFIDTAQILGYHREYYVLLTRGSDHNIFLGGTGFEFERRK